MKTILLILFLLLSTMGFGQQSLGIDLTKSIYWHGDTVMRFYSPEINRNQLYIDPDPYVILTIINLWDQYKKDCYNDSTVSYYYTLCDGGDCRNTPCEKGGVDFFANNCPAHWSHKSPNVLSEWMTWIEKKYIHKPEKK